MKAVRALKNPSHQPGKAVLRLRVTLDRLMPSVLAISVGRIPPGFNSRIRASQPLIWIDVQRVLPAWELNSSRKDATTPTGMGTLSQPCSVPSLDPWSRRVRWCIKRLPVPPPAPLNGIDQTDVAIC